MNGLSEQIMQIAVRIADMREIKQISPETMAASMGVSVAEYLEYESGGRDFPYTFMFRAAKALGVDIGELMTGNAPKLSKYTFTKAGGGLPIKRYSSFEYKETAYLFKDRLMDPLVVFAPYDPALVDADPVLSTHAGQEFDIVLKGTLKIHVDGRDFILNKGDSLYYDSSIPHGMTAMNPEGCDFIAVVTTGAGE